MVTLTLEELNLARQWFDAVQDFNPEYLEPADYGLAVKIHNELGMRVPQSITREANRSALEDS